MGPPRLLPAQATTIAHLESLPQRSSLPATRLPFERSASSLRSRSCAPRTIRTPTSSSGRVRAT
jgi:hypothetical protein